MAQSADDAKHAREALRDGRPRTVREDTGHGLRVLRHREDLSGPPMPPEAGQAPRGGVTLDVYGWRQVVRATRFPEAVVWVDLSGGGAGG